MRHSSLSLKGASLHFWIVALFVSLVFFIGGGSRDDIQSLVVLRPVAVLVLFFGLWGLETSLIRRYRVPLTLISLLLLLHLLQLIPMPPSLFNLLSGRAPILDALKLADIHDKWLPISMVPYSTLNSFFAIIVPMAAFICIMRCTYEEKYRIFLLIIGLGCCSAVLGIVQIIGENCGPAYFYKVTNCDAAVGLFSNANHQAFFLVSLVPSLAGIAGLERDKKNLSILKSSIIFGVVFLFILIIIVIGSRTGFVLMVFAIVISTLLFNRSAKIVCFLQNRKWRIFKYSLIIIVPALALTLMALADQFSYFNGVLKSDGEIDIRFDVWRTILKMIPDYIFLGSGFGSFVEVYQIYEPLDQLRSSYMNHAHNDILEFVLDGGIMGVILLACGVYAWIKASLKIFLKQKEPRVPVEAKAMLLSRCGSIIILIMGLASFSDYPLRVPSISVIAILSSMWLCDGYFLQTVDKKSLSKR